jgi:hypothetical protein
MAFAANHIGFSSRTTLIVTIAETIGNCQKCSSRLGEVGKGGSGAAGQALPKPGCARLRLMIVATETNGAIAHREDEK